MQLLNNCFFIVFLLLVCYGVWGKRKVFNDQYLDRDTTLCLKGLSALLVALHHIQQQGILSKYFFIFGYIGFIVVGLFFFLSGYGLTYGYDHKKDYLNGFLQKHLLAIYRPYWIVILATFLVGSVRGKQISFKELAVNLLGFSNHWFVTAILIFYIFFYISFRFMKRDRDKLLLLGILLFGYIMVCQFLPIISSYSASAMCFLFGGIWYQYQDLFTEKIRKPFFFPLIAVLFFVFFTGRLGLEYIGFSYEGIHVILRNAISITFVILVMTYLQYVQIPKKLFQFLGSLSLELYLVHASLLPVLEHHNLFLYLLLTIVCTLGLQQISKILKGGM